MTASNRWVSRTLFDIARGGLFIDGDWVESKDQDPNGDVRLTQLADVGVTEWRNRSDRWLREDQAARLRCTFLEPKDILIARMPDPIGRACLVPESIGRAVTVVDVAILRPASAEYDSRFLMWALNSHRVTDQVELVQAGATRQRVSRKNLGRVRLVTPALDEQRRIADFLDRETVQIDALIAKQDELVNLLGERRAALVRTSIPIPSQCEWPADKLGRRAQVGNGSTPRRDEERFWSGGTIPWLTSTVVNLNQVENASEFVTPVAVRECHLPITESGSLLIGLIGQGPTRGMATISRIRATLSQNLAYITPDPTRWVPEYLLWSLRASYKDIRQRGAESGAAQAMLNTDDIKRHLLVMPPLEAQSRIAAYLDDQTAKIDALITKAGEFIALARERRAALVTEAVTGRIDVSTGKAREGA